MNYYRLGIIFSIVITCAAYAKNSKDVGQIPYYVWDAEESNIGMTKVWFQNWSDYTRLQISSVTDSSILDPHPYAVTTFQEKYKNPIAHSIANHVLLIGNIYWKNDQQNWENEYENSFDWIIDRDQNWTYWNKTLNGTATLKSGDLDLVIKDEDQIIIKLKAVSRPYK